MSELGYNFLDVFDPKRKALIASRREDQRRRLRRWAIAATIFLHVGVVWILFSNRPPPPLVVVQTVSAVPETVMEARQSLAAQIASTGSLEQGGGGGGGMIQKAESSTSAEGPSNLRAKVEEQSRSAAELAGKPVEMASVEKLTAASASSSQSKLPEIKLPDIKMEVATAKAENPAQKEESSSSLFSKMQPSRLAESSPKFESKPVEMARSASELSKPVEQTERPLAKLEATRAETAQTEIDFAKVEIKMERAQPTRPVTPQPVQVAAVPQPTKPTKSTEPKKWGQVVTEAFSKQEPLNTASSPQEKTERPETVEIAQKPSTADNSSPTGAKTAPANFSKVANNSSAKPVESRVAQESLSNPAATASSSATAPVASGSGTPIKMEQSRPSASRGGSSASSEMASGTSAGQVAGRSGERLAGESSAAAGGGSSGAVSGQSSSATKGSAFEVVTSGELAATKTATSGSQSRMASGGGGSVSLKMEIAKPKSGGGSGGAGGSGSLSAGVSGGLSNSKNSSQGGGGGQLAGGSPRAGQSTGSSFSGTGQMAASGGYFSGTSAGVAGQGMGALASASVGGSTGGSATASGAGSGIKMERGQPGGSGSGARGGSGNAGEYSAGAGGPVSSRAGGGLAGSDGPAGQGGGGRATGSGLFGGAGKGNSVEGGGGDRGLGTSTVGNGGMGSGVGSGLAKGGGVKMEGARPGNGNGGNGNGGNGSDGSMAGGGSGLSVGKSGNGQLAGSGIKGDWNSTGLTGGGRGKVEGGSLEGTGLGTSLERATAPGTGSGKLFAGNHLETPVMERGPVTKSKPKPKPVPAPEETLSTGLNERLGGKLAGSESSLIRTSTVLAATKPSVVKGEAVESATKSEGLQVALSKSEGTLRNLVTPGKNSLEELTRLNDPLILRSPELRKPLIEQLGGSEETESAIRRSLEFLTRTQEKGGYWRSPKGHKIAPTALAMLCYMGYGGKHTEPGPYQVPLAKAMDWMISQVGKDGDLHDSGRMYDQCIASLALAEAYNLTKDPRLATVVPSVIGFIVRSQNPKTGGWRYHPFSSDPDPGDLSISGWALMALKSARLGGGAQVPDEAFARVTRFLDLMGAGAKGGLFPYRTASPEPKLSMTAEGMFCRQLLGAQPHQERMKESAGFLRAHLPPVGAKSADVNYYYWYYGCLALYQHQGPIWEEWNSRMKPILLKKQRLDGHLSGSWDAEGDREDDYGRVMSTMLATLSLEVYYRYLPLYNLQLASGEAAR